MIEILNDGTIKAINVEKNFDGILSFKTSLPTDTIFIATVEYNSYKDICQLAYMQTVDEYNVFKTKFNITKDVIDAGKVLLTIYTDIGNNSTNSNKVIIPIDVKKAKVLIKDEDKVLELNKKLSELERQFNSYTKGFVNPSIKQFNKQLAKKGMVYTVIDDNGNCAFVLPYIDSINKVNGKKAISKEVVLDSNDLKMNSGLTIEESIANVKEIIKKQQETITKLSEIIQTQNEDIRKLELVLEELTNTDII